MKKIIFGLVVAVMAIGFSAFTVKKDADKLTSLRAGEVWGNLTNTGNYSELPPSSFDPTNCRDANDYVCAYERTDEPDPTGILKEEMTHAEIVNAVNAGLLTPATTKKGIYDE